MWPWRKKSCERFLRPAIESILNQTFRDFELVVIDDCSTDNTPQILREFEDDRMRVVRNERNRGIAETLNNGIAVARGEYVALQDHGDVSLPARLECQVAFLDKNAQVGMLGSSCNVIDEASMLVAHQPVECDDVKLRWGFLWRTLFIHTTLMVRRRAIEEVGGYSPDPQYRRKWWHRRRLRTAEPAFFDNAVFEYEELVRNALAAPAPTYPRIPCVCPGWDNSPRRKHGATIFVNSTPEIYERWLREVVNRRRAGITSKENSGITWDSFVFINAWNEWAEGNHLEPCQRWGRKYLEATRRALGASTNQNIEYVDR